MYVRSPYCPKGNQIFRANKKVFMPYLKLKVNTLGHRAIYLERYCLTRSKRGRNKTQTKGIEKFFYHQDLFFILKGHHHARGIKSVSLSSQHLNLALSGRIGII